MLGAIPAVTVMKDLMVSRSEFELHDKNCLHVGSLPGRRTRVDPVDRDAFREQVELTHSRILVSRLP